MGQNCPSSKEFGGKRWQHWFELNLFTLCEELRSNKKCELFLSLGRAVDKRACELWKMSLYSHLVALVEHLIPSVMSQERLKPQLKLNPWVNRYIAVYLVTENVSPQITAASWLGEEKKLCLLSEEKPLDYLNVLLKCYFHVQYFANTSDTLFAGGLKRGAKIVI